MFRRLLFAPKILNNKLYYEAIKKSLHKLYMHFFKKYNTTVFVFAQFLRCVPSFTAIGPFGPRSEGGL